jgi:hypothetical protein
MVMSSVHPSRSRLNYVSDELGMLSSEKLPSMSMSVNKIPIPLTDPLKNLEAKHNEEFKRLKMRHWCIT